MELLRVPSSSLQVTYDAPEATMEYSYTIKDLADSSIIAGNVISTADSKVTIEFPSIYDANYELTIDEIGTDYIDIVRPYVDPTTKGSISSEVESYSKHEQLARAIIDSIIDDGFYYKKKVLEMVGLGADYLPIWVDAKKVLKVYENNNLIYDADDEESYAYKFGITDDKTAIYLITDDQINRMEGAPLTLPTSIPDIIDFSYAFRGFPKGFDYKVIVECGYKTIPSDIIRAAELLVHDIDCGKLDYYQRYITAYNTDQFRIQFDKMVFEGTGNLIVDKILSKYLKSIKTIGVL